MPCRYGSTPNDRVRVELVEADFEIGFSLVDLAEERPSEASRVLADAEDVYADVLARVGRLPAVDGVPFAPLVAELRRAIDLALARPH
jgi:orotate phosphoribosyltransferase-like protein